MTEVSRVSGVSRVMRPERPVLSVDPGWLALREPADAAARDRTAGAILEPLAGVLARRAGSGLRVVDLGAGTGANLRWLAPRLATRGVAADPGGQHWTLVERDPRLLSWGPVAAQTVHADVADLLHVLDSLGGADLVTAAALLDLLDTRTLQAVVEAAVAHRAPTLLSLSVTGAVTIDPPDPLDAGLAAAFDAHQRRGGRLGPDAGVAAIGLFRRLGWHVVVAQTPWRLDPTRKALMAAWLQGRAEAAVEWAPRLADPAEEWLARRAGQLTAGVLGAVVGHLDVLATPPVGA